MKYIVVDFILLTGGYDCKTATGNNGLDAD